MNQELVQQALGMLGKAMDAASEGAKYGYQIYARQKFAEGVVGLTIDIGITLLALIWASIVWSTFKKLSAPSDIACKWVAELGRDDKQALMIFLGILTALLFVAVGIVLGTNFTNDVLHLLNPQYYAIQDILNVVKSAGK